MELAFSTAGCVPGSIPPPEPKSPSSTLMPWMTTFMHALRWMSTTDCAKGVYRSSKGGKRRSGIRVFAFLVGMSETNAKNAAAFFRDKPQEQVVSLLDFRLSVAQRILDIHAAQKRAPARRAFREQRALLGEHRLLTIPVGCGRYTGKRDREHVDGFKKLSASRSAHKYQCQLCSCGKQIRSYCLCSPAHPVCIECYAEHRVQVALAE